MIQSSEALDYERAAFYRDRIELIAKIQSSQNINNLNLKDADVIGICKIGNDTCIQVFFIRSYENRGNHAFFPRTGNGADETEIIEHFLAQFTATNCLLQILYQNFTAQKTNPKISMKKRKV